MKKIHIVSNRLPFSVKEEGEKRGWKTYIPAFEYCTDNAGMIAIAAHFKYLAKDFTSLNAVPQPRMKF